MRQQPLIYVAAVSVVFYLSLILIAPITSSTLHVSSEFLIAMINTSLLSTIATAASVPVASILAYVTMNGRGSFLLPLITYTTAIPHTAVGVLLLPAFRTLGILDTWMAIVVAMWIVSTPLALATIRGAMRSTGREMYEFLKPLGLGDLTIYWFYVRSTIASHYMAILLSWLRSFSELGAFLIVAHRPLTMGIFIYESFLVSGAAPTIGTSLLLAALGMIFATIVTYLGDKR